MTSPALEVSDLSRHYGGVRALDGVSFSLRPGTVTALLGDNGAGKSTLVRLLSGAASPTRGEIRVAGDRRTLRGVSSARKHGIEVVFQDLALVPMLDAYENLYLGRELCRFPKAGPLAGLRRRSMRADGARRLELLGVELDRLGSGPVSRLSGGQRQAIAIARAMAWEASVILLDEPTAALGVKQTGQVLDLIRRAAESGAAVILITHSMPDVNAVADNVLVLRLGELVADRPLAEVSQQELLALMMGASVDV